MIFLTLFIEFFKVGLFCFGGAFGMLPLIEETVIRHAWLTESQFYDFVGICESTPGPIAVNVATYVGSTQGGLPGSLAASAGIIMPSFIIILIIASILNSLTGNKYFKGFMKGVKPVIAALILSTGTILLAKSAGFVSLKEFRTDTVSVLIFIILVLIFLAVKRIFNKKLPASAVVLISAVLGIGISCIVNIP